MLLRTAVLITIPLVLAYKLESGKELDSSRYSDTGEKGERGYVGHRQTEKGAQGHHDNANHRKEYAENGGHKKGYDHADGYYAGHHQGHKGRKGYRYEDHGKYAKGHSTKGRHDVHKLDEYKKNIDFFDENNDEGHEEKHGGYEASKASARGQHRQAGHFGKGFLDGRFGIAGFADKGSHYFDDKGHKRAQGQDEYFGNRAEFGQEAGQEGFKKFGFRSANKE